MSALKFNQWINPDGTENFKCRAWVNFNGTGTVAIRASGNVSSITDNGTGDYTVNFESEMPDSNYVVNGNGRVVNTAGAAYSIIGLHRTVDLATTGVRFMSCSSTFEVYDYPTIVISIFR